MDGVIFDSEKVYYDAFFKLAERYGIKASHDFVLGFSGKSSEDCFLILQTFFNNDLEKTRHFFRNWDITRLKIILENGLNFKEGFLHLFDTVKKTNRDTGLVTSAKYSDMTENFRRNNSNLLNEFKHIITIEDVEHPKPHPQPYQMMMRHLNYLPEECIVIEDSISGINAAIAANANTIMINERIQPPDHTAKKLMYQTSHHDNIVTFLKENEF